MLPPARFALDHRNRLEAAAALEACLDTRYDTFQEAACGLEVSLVHCHDEDVIQKIFLAVAIPFPLPL